MRWLNFVFCPQNELGQVLPAGSNKSTSYVYIVIHNYYVIYSVIHYYMYACVLIKYYGIILV